MNPAEPLSDPIRRRPTAPVQRRRRGRRWGRVVGLVVGVPLVLLVVLGLVGTGYQAVATARDRRAFPAPGRLVDVGGYALHLHCQGEGTPAVVLDASQPATVSSWVHLQPIVAERTRVCAYDRAGAGWSERGDRPRDMAAMADELAALLAAAQEPGPYLLVGHSWGGGVVRLLAARPGADVAGVVLVEAFHPDGFTRRGLPDSTLGGIPDAQAAALPAAGTLGITRLVPSLLADRAEVPGLPARQRAELRAYLSSPMAAGYLLDVERALPATQAALRAAPPLGDLPVAVVIGDASDNATGVGLELMREHLRLSTRAAEHHVAGADHSSLVHDPAHARVTAGIVLDLAAVVSRSTGSE